MKQTTDIELSGLTGSSPIGALAAFGLLRLCAEIPVLREARLAWRREDDWIAVLEVSDVVDRDSLTGLLSDHLMQQSHQVFAWADDIRVQKSDYCQVLQQSLSDASSVNRRSCDYLAAFASEMAVDNAKGLVKPTAFYMTSGQQKFLSSALELAESFKKDQIEKIREALFGPWLYRDKQHALGWDPAAERIYALRHKKPGEEAPTSVSAAVRLALESLPLYPVFPDKRGRLTTSGFVRLNRENAFRWPLWQAPISLDTLRSLLIANLENEEDLAQRGVTAVYSSIRSEFGQGYGLFRPAQLVWQQTRG
ncbi:hypothetical protein [Methylomonas sp. HYX-M1]|uniref:type I-G CRISPR-associated protein, Cas3-extension family n=1 Tax=Methylomonas sp. HYX-M1 TaxID=3139307 RepID=UPI00345C609B